jgi:hypothetical protein
MELINVQVDEKKIMEIVKTKISELVGQADTEFVYWDAKELMKRTCMSWNTIQDTFFFEKNFPKRKVGGKWYFPVRQTREFLEEWLEN